MGRSRPILDKRDSSERFARGCFGNFVLQWDSPADLVASGYNGLVVYRTRSPSGGGGQTVYDLSVDQAQCLQFDPMVNYFNEQLNDQHKHVLFQGEICRGIGGLDLHYSMTNQPMKEGLRDAPQNAHGLKALFFLRHFCCVRGLDCIQELMGEYPDHVIEFTVFDEPCGALGWRTIVWEVRRY